MQVPTNVRATIAVLLVAIGAVSCKDRFVVVRRNVQNGSTKVAIDQSRSIVGLWTSDPQLTQFGESTFSICFSGNGSFRTFAKTQAGPVENHGVYRLSGDSVIFRSFDGVVAVSKIRWQEDRLVLIDQDQLSTSYRRSAGPC